MVLQKTFAALAAAAVAAVVSLAGASPGLAQEDGPIGDPGSPSGKEYAIPFDEARREADTSGSSGERTPAVSGSGTTGGGDGNGPPPLFGKGIPPANGGPDGGRGSQRDPADGPGRAPSAGSGRASDARNASSRSASGLSPLAEGAWSGGGALLVVVLAGAAVLGLRLTRRKWSR